MTASCPSLLLSAEVVPEGASSQLFSLTVSPWVNGQLLSLRPPPNLAGVVLHSVEAGEAALQTPVLAKDSRAAGHHSLAPATPATLVLEGETRHAASLTFRAELLPGYEPLRENDLPQLAWTCSMAPPPPPPPPPPPLMAEQHDLAGGGIAAAHYASPYQSEEPLDSDLYDAL